MGQTNPQLLSLSFALFMALGSAYAQSVYDVSTIDKPATAITAYSKSKPDELPPGYFLKKGADLRENMSDNVIVELGETADDQTVINVDITPKKLYGYYSVGSQSLQSYSSAPVLNFGIGYRLNNWVNHLSAEFELAGNISKHKNTGVLYNDNVNDTLVHTNEKEVNTSSWMLNYRFAYFDQLFRNYSLEVRGKTGFVYWEERTYSRPLSDTNASNKVSVFDEKLTTRADLVLSLPVFTNAGIFLNYSTIGGELNRVTVGFQSSGREL